MIRKKKSVLAKATDLLANQEQSSAVLRQKLIARKYDAAEVDAAIAKLIQYNYLDDAENCRRQFENFYTEGKLSIRQIISKLIQRGFDKEFIDELIPDDSDEHDLATATRVLERKFTGKVFDRNKAWQFLAARGFETDIISSAIAEYGKVF